MELYNIEAEQAILGTCLMNNKYLLRVGDFMESKHFFEPANAVIWQNFIDIAMKGATVDQVTIKDLFANNEEIKAVGGKAYLSHLLSQASGVIDIREYGLLIEELWKKRQLFLLIEKVKIDLTTNSFDSISAELENELVGLAKFETKKKIKKAGEILDEFEKKENAEMIPTGFHSLDKLLNGGFEKTHLAIIGARPGIGKTSLMQQIILNASKNGKKCLFFSLEVDQFGVISKFLSNLSNLEDWKIKKRDWQYSKLEFNDLTEAKKFIRESEILVDDSSGLTIEKISKRIRNVLEKNPIDLICVDYVQIIKAEWGKGKNEATLIKEITTELKSCAKKFNVAVVAAAQINRKSVEGATQKPTINDFKSSGGIEEDADIAILLHRDRNQDAKGGYFSNAGIFIVAKNKWGQTGEIPINFEGKYSKFIEIGGF